MIVQVFLVLSVVLVVLGFGLVFFPDSVFKLNRFLNREVRPDTLFRRYNIWAGMFFLILGLILAVLYTGF